MKQKSLTFLKPFKIAFLTGLVLILAAIPLWFGLQNAAFVILLVLVGLTLVSVGLIGAFIRQYQLQPSQDVKTPNSPMAEGSAGVLEVLLYLILPW